MRLTIYGAAALAVTLLPVCSAQQWELGGMGGYGWYADPTITTPSGPSFQAGFPARPALGALIGNNMYNYVGGEVRWLLRFGGPQIRSDGIQANTTGYTNVITYDLLIHTASRDSKLRPFVAGGAGVKVYTGTSRPDLNQPLLGLAVLTQVTQTQPALSVGGGLKYQLLRHCLIRADFRTYMTPFPDELIRPKALSVIHGWVYDFVPTAGISYTF
jgi:hypothetical protein